MSLSPVTELAISLPFKIDALGKVGATVDQSKIWADRVRSVIGTALGQRVFRPEFGCNAALSVFNSEELVLRLIEEDITFAFQSHLPILVLDGVTAEVDPDTLVINVDVSYQTPNGADYAVQLGIATIDGNNPLSEEFAWQIQ